jgi:hypothetical protein
MRSGSSRALEIPENGHVMGWKRRTQAGSLQWRLSGIDVLHVTMKNTYFTCPYHWLQYVNFFISTAS